MQNATPFNYIFESGILVGGQGILVGMQAPTYSWNALRAGAEFGQAGNSIGGYSNDAVTFLTSGLYQDTSLNWKYAVSDYGAVLFVTNGMLQFHNAPTGTAGNAATLTERFRIDASGNAGMNVVPSAWGTSYKSIEVGEAGSAFVGSTSAKALGMAVGMYNDGTNWKYSYTGTAPLFYQQYSAAHSFYGAPTGTAGNTVTLTGVLTFGKGNTVALEGAAMQPGTGITFPAALSASSDANSLDDYEEGSWASSFALTINGSATGITYSIKDAYYIKIGRVVHAWFYFALSSKGASAGLVRITGFPFQCDSTSYAQGGGAPVSYTYAFAAGVTGFPALRVEKGTTESFLWTQGAGSANQLSDTSLTNTSAAIGTVIYEVAS